MARIKVVLCERVSDYKTECAFTDVLYVKSLLTLAMLSVLALLYYGVVIHGIVHIDARMLQCEHIFRDKGLLLFQI